MSLVASFKEAKQAIIDAQNIGRPTMIRGSHGIGKSQLIYQIIEEEFGLPIFERRISQMQEHDIMGLPIREGEYTQFLPPKMLWKACNKPVGLFFDEVDRSTEQVAQAFFELVGSRKMYGRTLHPETKIFAAINGGIEEDSYFVRELDPAEQDRWMILDVSPTVEEWLEWGRNNGVHNFVLNFIASNKDLLDPKRNVANPREVNRSRRSWTHVSKMIKTIEEQEGKEALNRERCLFTVAQAVGKDAAIAFCNELEEMKTPKFQEVAEGNFPEGADLEVHAAIMENFKTEWNSINKFSKKQLDNFFRYLKGCCPAEIGQQYIKIVKQEIRTPMMSSEYANDIADKMFQ